MSPPMKRVVVAGTIPVLIALFVVAFGALEQASVDSSVSAGRLGAYALPVWYVPLAVFSTAYTLCLLLLDRGRSAASLSIGLAVTALALAGHIVGAPFLVGEFIYGFALIFAVIFPPLIFLLPFLIALAIAAAGALYGFSIHAPIEAARRFDAQAGNEHVPSTSARALAIGGIVVAIVWIVAFGVPTEAARLGRGNYYFASESVSELWLRTAPVIALCCAIMVLAGALARSWGEASAMKPWVAGLVVPVGLAIAIGGPLLSAIQSTSAVEAVRSLSLVDAASRYFRDGRPRAGAAIRFAGGELRIDRSLIGYQTADNAQRRIVTVSLRVPPELEKLGVINRIHLNAWRAEPHRKEAEYRKADCTDSATRPVVECRLPSTGAVVIEIDRERPEFGLQRRALGPDPGCLLIITSAVGRAFSVRADLDCAVTDDWPRRAAEIERYFSERHVVR